MASRTYIPKLVGLLRTVCIYIVRWRPALDKFLTEPAQQTALDNVMIACDAFLAVVDVPTGD